MNMLDYDILMLFHEERLREAQKHRNGFEQVYEARVGRLQKIVRLLRRRNQPQRDTTEARRAHAL